MVHVLSPNPVLMTPPHKSAAKEAATQHSSLSKNKPLHQLESFYSLHNVRNKAIAMSLSIDLTTHGRALQQVYDKIISGSADTSWAVFSYDRGASNELKVQSEGGTTF